MDVCFVIIRARSFEHAEALMHDLRGLEKFLGWPKPIILRIRKNDQPTGREPEETETHVAGHARSRHQVSSPGCPAEKRRPEMGQNQQLEELGRIIASHLQVQQSAAVAPSQPATMQPMTGMMPMPSVGPQQFGLAPAPMYQPGLAAPQPTGVSVPVVVPLPDGRELSLRVHFGPEVATNLHSFAAACLQLFGSYLSARWPYRGGRHYDYRNNHRYDRR